MILPSCDKIEELAKTYNTIPIYKELYADMITTINLLRRLAQISQRYYLLESLAGGENWARYSFLGFDPIMRVSCKDNIVTIEEDGEARTIQTDKPYDVLRALLARYNSPRLADLPPFTGGFVGYFSYSMIGYAEPVLHIKRGDTKDFDLMLFDKVIAYDHVKQKIYVIVNMDTTHVMENYGRAVSDIESIIRIITDQQPLPKLHADKKPSFSCNVSKKEYCAMVERGKEYIKDGDIFQVVISRRFASEYQSSLLNAYRLLRTTNPSPYMVFMHINEEMEIICSSPETLVRLKDGRLSTYPVAGSRPRGNTHQEDIALEKNLLSDAKELAEHDMLVDLGRNDLGKISEFTSVEVVDYRMIHRYSKVMHIVSCVESNIREDCDAFSAVEAILPAGTLSGAPKIRACEIIEELESEPRGPYGGAIGYVDFAGNLDTCVAIRMGIKENGYVLVQAGGGIVADSVPELEYEESGNKAKALINAILKASEVNEG